MAEIQKNVTLAPYTSLKVGGEAERFVITQGSEELIEVLKSVASERLWLLGYGSNTLISDNGLPGLTICVRGSQIDFQDDTVRVDAGVWWDDVVVACIEQGLWGAELMSEIPGSVGGSLYINITAYGQSLGPLANWIDVWDREKQQVVRLNRDDLSWSYKHSIFQDNPQRYVILQAELQLSRKKTTDLTYQKAIDVADEMGIDINNLSERREIIIEARKRAGSIWHPDDHTVANTAGSFFRNPTVSDDQVDAIIAHDASGKTAAQIRNMNRVHGGYENRVSAAHVMLAAGFTNNQHWGNVKLNEHNLLKLETLPGATAQEVYAVMQEITQTAKESIGVTLEPEVELLGTF